ncbi:MAG: hypothetical protein JWO30_1266 [Fibrobacteres bacterium]|nr:hypothetical protein [Fibrobacterota bacterium]
MKIFHCDHCQHLVFFENFRCVACGRALGFLPDVQDMGSMDPAGNSLWQSPNTGARGRTYRLCANYDRENICNWTVPADDPNPLCVSCRLTLVIPDLSVPGNKEAWYRLESAKRRLIYSLLALGLPLEGKEDSGDGTFGHGVVFEFMADTSLPGAGPVLTGHNDGVITLNVAEADDSERERRRTQLHEPYRTLLGHFRHEIGHYYWDRLVADSGDLIGFRNLFGDERQDYGEALKRHYSNGAPADWQQCFVSTYASSHPWEDWAETWAHYLHMTDSLETAAACGLTLKPRRSDEPSLKTANVNAPGDSFASMVDAWYPLTYVLNNLNRGLGLPDGYPFVLSAPALEKLRFVHGVVAAARLISHL